MDCMIGPALDEFLQYRMSPGALQLRPDALADVAVVSSMRGPFSLSDK